MFKHKILLDTTNYNSKPDSSEVRKINNRIIENSVDIDIIELSKQLTPPNSRTMIPAHLRDRRLNKNWQSQSLFALDFDNGITFEEVLERLKDYGLDCAFSYSTFSSSIEHQKFRVVWQVNEVITDRKFRDEIQQALFFLFPEADKACSDASRIYFGGKELVYTSFEYFLDLRILFNSAQFHAIRNSSSRNMNRDLNKVKKKLGFHKNGSKKNIAYINNIETVDYASKNDSQCQIDSVRGVDFEELRKKIQILDDFMNSKVKLLHPQLLGLATNLRYIEGGQNLYVKCIKSNPEYAQSEKLKIMAYCKKCNYLPMSLYRFSLYEEDGEYGNLLNAAKKKEILRLRKGEKMTVEQRRRELKDIFSNVIKSKDKDVHVIKGFTGIGKTELYKDLDGVLIALPYHYLKDEVATTRMKVTCRKTPTLNVLPFEVKNTLDYYYSIGAFSLANQYISDMSKIYESVKDYRDECFACYNSGNTVLTTHQKAIFLPFWRHETIIFDEDITTSLMPVAKVEMNDLLRLETNIKNKNDKRVLARLINDIREGKVKTPRQMNKDDFEDFCAIEDEILNGNTKYESNIIHFFDAKYFVQDAEDAATISYINKYELPKDKKIIILSATADETIYKCLFGDRLKFYDLSNVEPVGFVEQDTKFSYSRSTFEKHIDYAIEKVGNLPVITFAIFKSKFPNPIQEMHWGYCSGSDKYKGQEMATMGTPHVGPITIALYATALGLPVETHEFSKVRQQEVFHNGFRFWFYTYDNQYLRNIQFYFIEANLKQAIGRCRPYTTPTRVLVLSNYPLPESSISKEEQDLGREKLKENARIHLEQCLVFSTLESEVTSVS